MYLSLFVIVHNSTLSISAIILSSCILKASYEISSSLLFFLVIIFNLFVNEELLDFYFLFIFFIFYLQSLVILLQYRQIRTQREVIVEQMFKLKNKKTKQYLVHQQSVYISQQLCAIQCYICYSGLDEAVSLSSHSNDNRQ